MNIKQALSEKLRSVFYDIDYGNKGYILYSDLRSAFRQADMEFTYATVGELFNIVCCYLVCVFHGVKIII